MLTLSNKRSQSKNGGLWVRSNFHLTQVGSSECSLNFPDFFNVSFVELKIDIKLNKTLFHRMHTGRVPILAFTEVLIPIKQLSPTHSRRKKIEKLPYSVFRCTPQPSWLLMLLMEDPIPGFSHTEDLFFITALNSFHLLARILLGATASS